ncbi:MAG TPA: DUF3500 domain-containing protein [Vicinamibacterales bacterium]|jgi:hypothetical protein|nr:DUF3500 domain-containing protein [Vicinamibacterales bacterium]
MSRIASRRFIVLALLTTVLVGVMLSAERSSTAMTNAATRFLAGLSPEQRQKASFPFDTDERFKWHYIPNEMFPREGLAIKAMTEPQRKLAHDLLKAGLSQRGYQTMNAIMELEAILKEIDKGPMVRDREDYRFAVFGTPSQQGVWGWRVGGHHVAVMFTMIKGGIVASSPTFAGTNPAEVRVGPQKGLRILAAQEDSARALLMALDASQRSSAIFAKAALSDIVTTNQPKVDPLPAAGLVASSMAPAQRDMLMKVIESYTSIMADDIAAERVAKVRKAGIERIAFAWAGEVERGRKHYYRVQGPTFLIEFDNTQDDANHIHSVWRDFDGDYGRDILREHLRSSVH